jgi:hypothetical protein
MDSGGESSPFREFSHSPSSKSPGASVILNTNRPKLKNRGNTLSIDLLSNSLPNQSALSSLSELNITHKRDLIRETRRVNPSGTKAAPPRDWDTEGSLENVKT